MELLGLQRVSEPDGSRRLRQMRAQFGRLVVLIVNVPHLVLVDRGEAVLVVRRLVLVPAAGEPSANVRGLLRGVAAHQVLVVHSR